MTGMLLCFLVLLLMNMVVTFISNMHFRTDYVLLTDQHVRRLVVSLQVSIVRSLVLVHSLFMIFICVVKQDHTSFVLVSTLSTYTID